MSIKSKMPKKEDSFVLISGRCPRDLKERAERVLEKLKKSQPNYRWSFNSALIAGLETFLELAEKDL